MHNIQNTLRKIFRLSDDNIELKQEEIVIKDCSVNIDSFDTSLRIDARLTTYTVYFYKVDFDSELNIINILDGYFNTTYVFDNCTFHKKLNLNNQILNNVTFKDTVFKSEVCFKKTKFFGDKIKFIGGAFDEHVDFSSAVFGQTNSKSSEVYFNDIKFQKGVKLKTINKNKYFNAVISFSNIEFKQELDLSKCHFANALEFEKCIFNEKVDFHKSIFEKHEFKNKNNHINLTRFTSSNFKKGVNFKNTNFVAIISFINVVFSHNVEFNNSTFNDKALFKRTVFKRDFFGKNIFFKKECHFNGVTFKGDCTFSHSVFNDEANFKDAKFFKSTYFNRSIFNKKALFCSAIFKNIINFYFSIFKNVVNFSSCVFEKANFVNMIGVDVSNLTIEHLEKHITFNNEEGYIPSYRKIQECQNLKDSFRTIKDVLISQNNTIEAIQWHKLELYMSELEIKYKRKINDLEQEMQGKDFAQQDEKEYDTLKHALLVNKANQTKNIYNEYQLKVYRLTSDHHSDLSKIFFFTLSMLGLYMFLVSLLAFIIDGYATSFNFALFDENIFQLIVQVFDSINLSFMSSILMKLCAVVITIVVLLAICCLIDLIKVKMPCQGSIFLKTLVDLTTQHLTTITLIVLTAFVVLMCIFSHFNLLINLVLYCILFIFLMVFLMNLNPNALIAIGSFGVLCFIYQPSIAAPFLGIVSDNAKNYNLIKSIHDLNNNETNELYSLFMGRNIQTNEILYLDSSNGIYSIQHKSNDLNNKNLKQVLLEHKDIIKEDILKDVYKGVENSSIVQIQKSVAKDQIIQSINAIYYIVLFLCLFSLQKTARRNSIVPS